jgi:hypothetical protein
MKYTLEQREISNKIYYLNIKIKRLSPRFNDIEKLKQERDELIYILYTKITHYQKKYLIKHIKHNYCNYNYYFLEHLYKEMGMKA